MANISFPVNNPPDDVSQKKKDKRRRLRKDKKKQRQKKNLNKNIQDGTVTSSTEAEHQAAVTCPEIPVPIVSGDFNSCPFATLWQHYRPQQVTLIRGANWYSERAAERHAPRVVVDLAVRRKLKDVAAEIYKNELKQFEVFEENSGGRDIRFRRQILTHGAAKDKIAVHILCITEAPVHSLHHLDKIATFIASNKDSQLKEIAKSVLEALSVSVLPKGLVARPFEQHDFQGVLLPFITSDRNRAEKQLLLWYYEDQLRQRYTQLVQTLQQVLQTSSEATKLKAVQMLLQLLGNHPSQDAPLILQVLVNKLGDLDRAVCNAVVYGVRTLLVRRPALKGAVVDTCGELLYRPNQRSNTLYNCMLLLKDVLFSKDDGVLAQRMLKLYFGFFKACTKQGEVDGKLLSIILRGLHRALPYLPPQAAAGGGFLSEQFDLLYKLTHLTRFTITVQVLQLLYQVIVAMLPEGELSSRYHRVLYGALLSPELSRSSAAAAFLNLVYKTMTRMTSSRTLAAFTKRLLQVCPYLPTQHCVACVYLLAEVCADNPRLVNVIDGHTADVKQEQEDKKEKKLLLIPGVGMESETVCVVDPLAAAAAGDCSDDGEEYYEDLDVGPDGQPVRAKEQNKSSAKTADEFSVSGASCSPHAASSATLPKPPLYTRDFKYEDATDVRVTRYDPLHRDPAYCGAHLSQLWELRNVSPDYHPSVSVFIQKLLKHEPLGYTGDPFLDFTLMKFLDRFVYKNPKKVNNGKLDAGARTLGAKSQYNVSALRSMNVATQCFRKLNEDKVPEDAKFFHKFFTQYSDEALKSVKRKSKETIEGRDPVDVDDDEFEAYLRTCGGKDGEVQMQYEDDDELDDEWDFAARTKKSDGGAEGSDFSDESEDESDCDSDAEGGGSGSHSSTMEDDGSEYASRSNSTKNPDLRKANVKSKKRGRDALEEETNSEDGWDSLSDMGSTGGGDELNFDEEDVSFSDEDDLSSNKKNKKMKMADIIAPGRSKRVGKERSLQDMLVDADEFSAMLQQNETCAPAVTRDDFVHTGKISSKQLKWERANAARLSKSPKANKNRPNKSGHKDKKGMAPSKNKFRGRNKK